MNKVRFVIILLVFLQISGCTSRPRSQSNVGGELTLTCAYHTLKEMDIITKVSIAYDHLPHLPTFSRSHLSSEDGIEFEGDDFFGFVSQKFSIVKVFLEEGYFNRNFVPWGHAEKRLKIKNITQKIKETLYNSCVE